MINENDNGTVLKRVNPLNPFMGKTFKILTYNQVDQVVNTETVTIESQEELKTTLDSIKQYNDEHAQLEGFLKLTKKLITE
mgnify:CR=1 FL=1|nr:MAG: hypothetical protein [Bacteriophage sp.]